MATPILQRIPAFNASEGTEFVFNVVGTTTFIRSSKVSIYDSNNNKICTHIFNSTQLKHILPSNTAQATESNPAIVYESGKTSNDFVNGRSYYLEMDVYTTLNATGESAGTSTRMQFWCLNYPVIQFINPHEDIDIATSSYTFDVNYNVAYPIGVKIPISNKAQIYRFDLYKSTLFGETLIKSSNNIYGAGTEIEENKYYLSYTFSGLENANNYFVRLTITTEQGMVRTVDSDIVTVSLEDISFAVAQVKNDACNGSIEITSNMTNIPGDTNADFHDGDMHIDLSYIQCTSDDKYDSNKTYYIISNNTYVATAIDEATFNEDKTRYYVASNYYLAWTNSNGLDFPVITVSNNNTMRWSIVLKAKKFVYSSDNPFTSTESCLVCLKDKLDSNGVFIYMRKDDENIFAELYAVESTANPSKTVYINSNAISNVDRATDVYFLIRCFDGMYDIVLSKSLPQ